MYPRARAGVHVRVDTSFDPDENPALDRFPAARRGGGYTVLGRVGTSLP